MDPERPARVAEQAGPAAAVGYSNLGLDIDQIVIAVIEHVRAHKLSKLYFYGHSFGGMVATQVAARLRELHGVEVAFILLDSSPYSRIDVLDQSWFEGVVFLYESGFRFPTVLRGGYELGERMLHKDERSWRQILDQTLEQLSPIAPSSVLIQSESAYIYHFDAQPLRGQARRSPDGLHRQPQDRTVDYETARDAWRLTFEANMVSDGLQTDGARPAHASPGWNPFVYRPIIEELHGRVLPAAPGGGKKTRSEPVASRSGSSGPPRSSGPGWAGTGRRRCPRAGVMPLSTSTVCSPASMPAMMSVSIRSPIMAVVSECASIWFIAERNIIGFGLPTMYGSRPVALVISAAMAPVAGIGPSLDGPVASGLVAMKRAPARIRRMAMVIASKE